MNKTRTKIITYTLPEIGLGDIVFIQHRISKEQITAIVTKLNDDHSFMTRRSGTNEFIPIDVVNGCYVARGEYTILGIDYGE